MNSLPTQSPYEQERQNNDEKAQQLMGVLFPKLKSSHALIYQLIYEIEQSEVNPEILPRIMRGVSNVLKEGGSGDVVIHVVDNQFVNIETKVRSGTITWRNVQSPELMQLEEKLLVTVTENDII